MKTTYDVNLLEGGRARIVIETPDGVYPLPVSLSVIRGPVPKERLHCGLDMFEHVVLCKDGKPITAAAFLALWEQGLIDAQIEA